MANVRLTRVASAGDLTERNAATNRGYTSLPDGIRDRMPVMLMRVDYDRWLDPAISVDELRAMLKPYDAG